MNLQKLFETQKVLRDRINYNEPDRFNKLVLALLVELGECANEWRGFKFWSKNQEPRTLDSRRPYMNLEDADFYNPLLEEYVDGLHFVLELGIEIHWCFMKFVFDNKFREKTIDKQFLRVMELAINMQHDDYYYGLLNSFVHLGEMLGFTWEQIEQAYFEKNQINHRRQDDGY